MNKKVVLLLSRVYPKYHSKRGKDTGFRSGLGVRKKHSIRASYDQWRHNLDKVIDGDFVCSVREWTGLPYKSVQREFATFTGKEIGYQRISMVYDPKDGTIGVLVDGHAVDVRTVARNEGLSVEDFREWYFGEVRTMDRQVFEGIVIHFTGLRYQ